jgi:hypothetical protein
MAPDKKYQTKLCDRTIGQKWRKMENRKKGNARWLD